MAGRKSGLTAEKAAMLASVTATAGVFAVLSTAFALWALWVTDPLKSIGGFVPVVSLWLVLRVWRSLGWAGPERGRDAAWGLGLLVATIVLVHVREVALIEFVVGPSWAVFVPPHQLVALAYGVGCVLVFGGVRLLRRAAFPVALLWLVNPVPNFFTLSVDLPLQRVSSLAARGFAHALGQRLSPDQLRLMFTPEFGMFIAPGCNGIRGAITMGMIALVAGYLYRFKLRAWVGAVGCAVLLGYVFNLVRLCALVVYYIFALHAPLARAWWQAHAAMADYIIGACLFFVAGALLVEVVRRFGVTGGMMWPPLVMEEAGREAGSSRSSEWKGKKTFWWRYAGFLAVLVLGSVSYVRALAAPHVAPLDEAVVNARFPRQVGAYTLMRQWDETLLNGPRIFHWLEYEDAAGERVSVGVSPVLGAHDTLICHAARGEDWLWHGALTLPTRAGPTQLSGSLFNDGTHEYLEAATVCSGESCGQYTSERRHFGFVFSKPDTGVLLGQSPARPIPVLIHAEVADAATAPELARAQLTAVLGVFLAGVDLAEFTQPYREK
jgi:exosortase J